MRLINLQWIHNFRLIDWTKKMLQMSDLLLDEAVFFAFPSVIPADYRIYITRRVLLHIHTDTHIHISRKVSIAATAMTINSFRVGVSVLIP